MFVLDWVSSSGRRGVEISFVCVEFNLLLDDLSLVIQEFNLV